MSAPANTDRDATQVVNAARYFTEALGLALVDIPPGSKGPRAQGWNAPGAAIRDPEAAARYWEAHPDHGMGCLHSESGTAALDIDLAEAVRVLALAGVDVAAVTEAATLRIVGNPRHPAKPIFRVPAGVSLSTRKLTWPSPEPGRKPVTVFELRAGPVQDVLPPTVHPETGQPYALPRYPKPGESLTELPPALLDLWQRWDEFLPTMQAACPWAQTMPERPAAERSAEWDQVRAEILRHYSLKDALAELGVKLRGHRACCPFHDEKEPSFWTFEADDGIERWCCAHGGAPVGVTTNSGYSVGDAIDLYAHRHSMTAGRATGELAKQLGLEAPGGHGSRAIAGERRDEGDAWPVRQPIPMADPMPTLPAELVPHPLRLWLEDAAERASIPLEMVAAPAMVVAGAVVGRSIGIRPEGTRNPWTVVANLWGGPVAPPGFLKSAALGEAASPLRPLEAEAREAHKLAMQDAEVDKAALGAELARLKSRKVGQVDREAIASVMKELRECEPPERRYATQDATIEKLGEILVNNPRGILLLRDELAGWIAGFDRAGREGERSFFLEAWNATGSFTVDRIARGTVHIPALCMSVLGTIQPGRVSSYVAEALAGGGGADGLLQRLQVVVWPDTLPPYRRTAGAPDRMARERAFAVYRALDNLKPATLGAVLQGTGGVLCLAFDPDAQLLFDAWRDELETRLRSDELQRTPAFCSHLAKYRSLMPALALLFHLIEAVGGSPSGALAVPVASAVLAAAWCDFLEAHARKLYRRELVADIEGARLLAAKIEAGDVRDGQPVRDLYRPQWAGLRSPDLVWQAVAALERLGWVRVIEQTTGGRPSYAVRLHPDLKDGGA
jgi:hypothetical protein